MYRKTNTPLCHNYLHDRTASRGVMHLVWLLAGVHIHSGANPRRSERSTTIRSMRTTTSEGFPTCSTDASVLMKYGWKSRVKSWISQIKTWKIHTHAHGYNVTCSDTVSETLYCQLWKYYLFNIRRSSHVVLSEMTYIFIWLNYRCNHLQSLVWVKILKLHFS